MIIGILEEIGFLFLEMAPYLMLGLFFVGLLHLLITKEMVVRHMGQSNLAAVVKASLFGVPLPLCSCGVIPTSVFMARNGASKSSVVSFLISTPQTGIDSIVATYGMMGGVFAIFRPIAAFAMGIIGGTAIKFLDKKNPENKIDIAKLEGEGETCTDGSCSDSSCDDGCCDDGSCETELPASKKEQKKPWPERIKNMAKYSFVEFLDDIAVQFIAGLIIAGLISYFIPDNFFANSFINDGILGMLIMIVVGIPMYVCATGSIPIALSLMMKGFSPGVAFVFLAAGPATNAASLTIISKVLGRKVAIAYVALIAILSIGAGYLLDFVFSIIGRGPMLPHVHDHDAGFVTPEIKWTLGVIFFILIVMSLYRKYLAKYFKPKKEIVKMDDKKKFEIEGMTCNHCVANVKKAIEKVEGVENVDVDLVDNAAYVKGNYQDKDIIREVEAVGYKVVEK